MVCSSTMRIRPAAIETPRIKKIEALESVRGLAALLVVFFHIGNSPFYCLAAQVPLVSKIIENGYLMVDLFFVLSGFVISSAYRHNITTFKELYVFQFLRFGRLYPIHLFFLLIYLSLETARYIAVQRLGLELGARPFETNTLTAFGQQLLLLQAIGPTENELSFNGAAWSISTEFYTYLIWGLVVLFCTRLRWFTFILICGLSIMLLASQTTFGFENLLRCTAGFFLGCLVRECGRGRPYLPAYLSGFALVAILVFLGMKPSREFDVAIYFLTAIAIFTIVRCRDGWAMTMLNSKALTFLGAISYSLYMSHSLIIWGFEFAFLKILGFPATRVDGKLAINLTLYEAAVTFTAFMFLVLLISYVLYRFVEQPMRELSRRIVISRG